MKTYEVAKLSGVLLDAAIAQVEGLEYRLEVWPLGQPKLANVVLMKDGKPQVEQQFWFEPHRDARFALSYMERDKLSVMAMGEEWLAVKPQPDGKFAYGANVREAVLRLVVLLKFGETIDLPWSGRTD